MRMRKKPNLEPRMEKCARVLVGNVDYKGKWRSLLPGAQALELELGCGKGRFTADLAAAQPETLLIALEKVPDAMVIAMERVCARELSNVRFLDTDADRLTELFAPGEVENLYINFCDPWPKSRDAKFRLTAPVFLRRYGDILALGGEIRFKTDNEPLFRWSIRQFQEEGWSLRDMTDDLHSDGPVGIMTDYEARFAREGIPIHRLVAVKTVETRTTAAGPVPRLHNAALTDARGYRGQETDYHAG